MQGFVSGKLRMSSKCHACLFGLISAFLAFSFKQEFSIRSKTQSHINAWPNPLWSLKWKGLELTFSRENTFIKKTQHIYIIIKKIHPTNKQASPQTLSQPEKKKKKKALTRVLRIITLSSTWRRQKYKRKRKGKKEKPDHEMTEASGPLSQYNSADFL